MLWSNHLSRISCLVSSQLSTCDSIPSKPQLCLQEMLSKLIHILDPDSLVTTPQGATDAKQLSDSTTSLSSRRTTEIDPKIRNDDAVRILETNEERQRGVFTKHDFPSHHMIIKERPMLSCIHWPQRNGVRSIDSDWQRLNPDRQREIRDQFTRLEKVPVGRKLNIWDRRRLRNFVKDYAFWDSKRTNAHIYRLGSHINHACISCANAQQWTDSEHPNYISIKLVKPLNAGDEVFISYNKPGLPFRCAVCDHGKSI